MNKIGHLLILSVTIFSMSAVSCTKKVASVKISESSYLERATVFPADWAGSWLGDLEIYTKDGLQQQVQMGLDILPTAADSIYTWQISYLVDSVADVRAYSLHILDRTQGHYKIDENNGILLDGYLLGDRFISVFEVMGNVLQSVYTLQKDRLHFEITMHKSASISSSGDTLYGGDKIPNVDSYAVTTYQHAVLYKVEAEVPVED